MQNAQNTDMQRVINLVELYRTKVGKESQIAKDAKFDHDLWEEDNLKRAEEDFANGEFFSSFVYGEGSHTEVWTKGLMVNEQLLGHFYAEVAGENAEQDVLDQLLPEVYDKSVYTEEEEIFLKFHFKEMVNYIIQTPNNDLTWVYRSESKDMLVIPNEVLELIRSRVKIAADSTIYYPNVGFAQMTDLFKECKFLCYKKHAWSRVALYANNACVEFLSDQQVPSSYDALISFLPKIIEGGKDVRQLSEAYENLQHGGVFILLCPSTLLIDEVHLDFRRKLVEDNAIQEIIQLPSVMSEDACLIIAQKGLVNQSTTFIDARFAGKDSSRKDVPELLDMDAFTAMIHNSGKEANTGLRKVIQVPSSNLNPNLLIPQIYVVERPTENEGAVPLSELCSIATMRISDITFNLPEDTPWVEMSDLSHIYRGPVDLTNIRKAECPNNPSAESGTKDYAFDKSGKFFDHWQWQIRTSKGLHVLEYRRCTYLDGSKDAVLLRMGEENVGVAVVPAKGNPVAVSSGIKVFVPNEKVAALTLVAILKMPIVYRQIKAYQVFGLEKYMDEILVPTDLRIIRDEERRLKDEHEAYMAQQRKYEEMHKQHEERLCNYQHGMRKHIREISSAVRRMERYITDIDLPDNIKDYLRERLNHIKDQRMYLSEDIERLNEETTYGEAVPFDIDHSLSCFQNYFGSDGYPVNYSNEVAKKALKQYIESHRKELSNLSEADRKNIIERVKVEKSYVYVDIAEYNFGKLVRNILENARKHGFDGLDRDNCAVEIILQWDSEREMYRIDFRNNGNPLPEGLSKESYGENRKYAGKTGETGIGGYEVAENVKHYNGDYEICQDGDWAVVSIYLPKSKSYEEGI